MAGHPPTSYCTGVDCAGECERELGQLRERDKLFDVAMQKANELMAVLYDLRSRFQPSSEVWHHIPFAQTTLEKVKAEIQKAKENRHNGHVYGRVTSSEPAAQNIPKRGECAVCGCQPGTHPVPPGKGGPYGGFKGCKEWVAPKET